ncbi:MAG: hypothetical protein ACYTHN_20350, partial [Planctomycetota bacterium]
MAEEKQEPESSPRPLPRRIEELPPLRWAEIRNLLTHVRPHVRFLLPLAACMGIAISAGLPIPSIPLWIG